MLVLGAVVAGLAFGPAIPGAHDAALIDLQGTGGNPARVTLSPLVDIRGRLSDRSEVEVFAEDEDEAVLVEGRPQTEDVEDGMHAVEDDAEPLDLAEEAEAESDDDEDEDE